MSEEEKQAIERMREVRDKNVHTFVDELTIVLNLIEKQNKEIEELKEYIHIAPNLDEMTAVKYTRLQRNAYFRGRQEEQRNAEQIIYENYIPKSVVREKIEALDDSNSKFYKRVANHTEYTLSELVRNILKEVLGE